LLFITGPNLVPYEQAVEKPSEDVTPAKAGVQNLLKELDSCFRRNDNKRSKSTFSTACEDVTVTLYFHHCR
jgi:hypothetical protein